MADSSAILSIGIVVSLRYNKSLLLMKYIVCFYLAKMGLNLTTYKHGGHIIVKFSFRFCCFVFGINQLKVKFVDYYVMAETDFE